MLGEANMKAIRGALVLSAALLGLASHARAAETPNYKIVDRIKVPDGGFDYATFDASTGNVYMPRGSFTTVIDVKTGKVSQLASGASDHIALAVPGTNLMVLTQRRGVIRIADKATDMVLADLPGGKNPNSAAYDPVTELVFVMNKDSGDAALVDPVARKVVATIPISPNTLEFPVADGAGKIFDNIETTAEIAVIDTKSRKVTGTYKLAGCEEPSGLAYAADSKLLISSCGNGLAKVVQADTGKEVASLPIGRGPDAVIYDPSRKLAFIPCGRDGVMDVISLADPAHIAVVQRIQTQAGSRTGTVDPGTGRLYLMASKPDPNAVPPPGGRGVPRLAGSWEVLIIGP
jgi:DNA-binding beta-propeller fold protein YncE